MNAFVFSSPAHAFQRTVWPRAVATIAFQSATGNAAHGAASATARAPAPARNRRRVMSFAGGDYRNRAHAYRSARLLVLAPPARLVENRPQHLLVKTVAADAQIAIRAARR